MKKTKPKGISYVLLLHAHTKSRYPTPYSPPPSTRPPPLSLSLSFSFLLPPFPRIHDNLFYSFFYSVFSSLAIYLSVCLSITRHFTRSLTRISHTIRGIVVDHFHSLGPLTHSLTHPLSLTLIGFSIPFTMTVLPT